MKTLSHGIVCILEYQNPFINGCARKNSEVPVMTEFVKCRRTSVLNKLN